MRFFFYYDGTHQNFIYSFIVVEIFIFNVSVDCREKMTFTREDNNKLCYIIISRLMGISSPSSIWRVFALFFDFKDLQLISASVRCVQGKI